MIDQNVGGLNNSSQKENKIVNEQEQNQAVNTGNDPFTNAENLSNPTQQPEAEKTKEKSGKSRENSGTIEKNGEDLAEK
jgi:hypothetical protein